MSTSTTENNTKRVVLHVVGYEKCPYFYQSCLYAAVCKNRKRCLDYRITSFETPKEFTEWTQRFLRNHPQTSTSKIDTTSSPFVFDDTDNTYLGGFSELFTFMQDIVVPNDQNQGEEQKHAE